MKRKLLFTLLLGALSLVCSEERLVTVAPAEEWQIRKSLHDQEELKPLEAEYQQLVAARLKTLTEDQITNVFGPQLETIRKLDSRLFTNHIALPLFAPDTLVLSGLLVTNDLSHHLPVGRNAKIRAICVILPPGCHVRAAEVGRRFCPAFGVGETEMAGNEAVAGRAPAKGSDTE
jgi:hypothetical protein